MLVAEKRQYMEPYYPQTVEKEQPTPRIRVVPKGKPRHRNKVVPIAIILIGFAVCSYTVARFAMIAQKQQEILELQEILEKQQGIQEHLKLELTARGDLERIEEFAKSDLDMDYPDKEQVLFVELPEQNSKETADAPIEFRQKESLWSKIIGLLD